MNEPNKSKSQFNLQDIDTAKLTEALSEHQNTLDQRKLSLVIGSLFIAVGWMVNNFHLKEKDLRTQMSQAQDKLAVIKTRDAAVSALNEFKSSVPKKLNEFDLITLISDYAKAHHVSIFTAFSPAERKDMGIYDLINNVEF